MHRTESCCRPGCSQSAVASLREESFCLNHFCGRCYELLERIDDRAQLARSDHSFPQDAIAVADDCARVALHVSLNTRALGNLERARLLDILLWSGDIVNTIRDKVAQDALARARSPYKKPLLGRQKATSVLPS